ncbi:MAG: ATP-binding protein [Bdellovibrionota bacterium]|nr:MAG: sensor histidine kinase [Pseudomonadota bacterium]
MQKPAIPTTERERLRALLEYEVLDTACESTYDDVVKLASMICGTPMALISLVDQDRQWFKAHLGIEATEMPREISFCGHAIHGEVVFEVPDAQQDIRFFDNPLVTGEAKIRYYAGAPLITPEGHVIGTLCVVDLKPRLLTEEIKEALTRLSKLVMRQLETDKKLRDKRENFDQMKALTKRVAEQEIQLNQAEKLRSLGEMAGGIAHEINSPLSVIQSSAAAVIRRIQERNDPRDVEIESKLTKVIETVARISEITRGMLLYSRDGRVDDLETCSVSEVMSMAMGLIRGQMSNQGIQYDLIVDSDMDVVCSKQKVVQIMTNLLQNSRDAIEGLSEKWIVVKVKPNAARGQVEVCVEDSGNGIPFEIREKMSRPFFTTKPAGRGTGLGLNICRNLAKAQGGSLFLDESAAHTTFVLSLPAARAA